ncbi:MAG: PilZ domain-containing protein [Steroidobacteraceae bacterium]
MYEGIDTVVLFEELAYEEAMPVRWLAYSEPLSASMRRGFHERNLKLLQTCILLDEHVQADKSDERSPYHADIIRLDMKVNLLLDLVGHLLSASHPLPDAFPIRFNAQGAVWKDAALSGAAESTGVLEIHLHQNLFDPLRFPGQLVSVSASGLVKVKFESLGDAVADLIDKLAFRRHRRHVAVAKCTGRDN